MTTRNNAAHALLISFFQSFRDEIQPERMQGVSKLKPGRYDWNVFPRPPTAGDKAVVLRAEIFRQEVDQPGIEEYMLAFYIVQPVPRPLFTVFARHIYDEPLLYVMNCMGHEYAVTHMPYCVSRSFAHFPAEWPFLRDLFICEAGWR